jgi:Flp pilus assembly protein TadB
MLCVDGCRAAFDVRQGQIRTSNLSPTFAVLLWCTTNGRFLVVISALCMILSGTFSFNNMKNLK